MLSTFLKSSHSVIRRTSNSMLLSAIKSNLRTHANMVSDSKAGLLDSPGWSPLKCKQVWLCLFHYYKIRHFFLFFNWRETALQCFVGFCPYNNTNQLWFCMYPLPPLPHPTILRTTDLQRGGLLLGWAVPSDCPGPSWVPTSMCCPLAHGVKERKLLSLHPLAAELVVRGPQCGTWQEVTTMGWNQKLISEHRGCDSADRNTRSKLRFPALSVVSWVLGWAATQQGSDFHSFCLPISPIGLWSPRFVCYSPSCSKSPVIFSPGHNQSPRLINLKPLKWPLLMADFHLLIEISSFELMLNILIFQ